MGIYKGRLRAGNIVLCYWENEAYVNGNVEMIPNFTISRFYTDKKTGGVKYTNNFRENDLPKIANLISDFLSGDYELETYDKDGSK